MFILDQKCTEWPIYFGISLFENVVQQNLVFIFYLYNELGGLSAYTAGPGRGDPGLDTQ